MSLNSVETIKTIGDVFTDFNHEGNFTTLKIKTINLFKKHNILELKLVADCKVYAKDLYLFETYLKSRFSVDEVRTEIHHVNKVEINDLQTEWPNISCYIIKKYPTTIGILKNSSIEIKENKAIVTLQVKGMEFLNARGIDKELGMLLENLYGTKYIVNYIEDINVDAMQKQKEYERKMEEEAIRHIAEMEMMAQEQHKQAEKMKEQNKEEKIDNTNKKVEQTTETEDKSPLIYGRSATIKEARRNKKNFRKAKRGKRC